MTLSSHQYSFRGLTFGSGTSYPVRRVEGLEGFEVRSSDSDLPRADGAIRGLDYVAPRTIALEFALGAAGYESIWAQIRETFRPSRDTDFQLKFKAPDMVERMVRCRPIQLIRAEEVATYGFAAFPPVVLRATDPRIYSTEEHSGIATVYSASGGGIDFDFDFDEDYGAATANELVVSNAGTANAYPVIRFYGPTTGTVDGVTLTNSTTGQELEVSAAITTGQILQADMEAAVTGANRLVIALGGSTRYGDWELPREAFYLAPGSNTLRFEVDGTSTDALCVVTWRDTWID